MKIAFQQEKAQGLVEYALILVLVAIVVIGILLLLGPVVGNVFSNVTHFSQSRRVNRIAGQRLCRTHRLR